LCIIIGINSRLCILWLNNGKVKHKTIANLSSCSEDEIKAIKLALKHKNDLTVLSSVKNVKTILGKRMGAVWVMYELAKRLGIVKALGSVLGGKLALLQIIARICDQGSRLSAVRFAKHHAICEIVGIEKLDEDDLYENLKWLADEQETIEKKCLNCDTQIRFRLCFYTM